MEAGRLTIQHFKDQQEKIEFAQNSMRSRCIAYVEVYADMLAMDRDTKPFADINPQQF